MEDIVAVRKCRTCLKNSVKSFSLIKQVRGCSPKKTYGQLLKEYAQFEYNNDYEHHMPQHICLLCCRQLRNIYVFIQKAQHCNLKLINAISKRLDCLREQAIDLPKDQDKAFASIKEESRNVSVVAEDRENSIENSFASDNYRTHESILNTNKSSYNKTQTLLENKEELVNDFKSILEKDNNIRTNEDMVVLDKKDENSLLYKAENLDAIHCPVCSKLIANHYDLVGHLRIQHDVTEATSLKLLNKPKPLPEGQIFICNKCTCTFNNKYDYLKHIKKKHESSKATDLENGSIREQRTDKRIIKCHFCDYTAKSYAALNYHNRSKHGTEDDKLKCKFCLYTSFKKCNLLIHVKNAHKELIKSLKVNSTSNAGESVNSNACNNSHDNCIRDDFVTNPVDEEISLINNNYSSDDDDEIQLAQTTTKKFRIDAEQDKEEFSDEDFIRNILNIKKRQRKMLSTSGLARRCEECGNIYKNYKSLSAHKRTVHISEDKFSLCPHCGKKYKRKVDLRIHIEKAHVPQKDKKLDKQQTTPKVREKRFMCTECSYTCSTITILNIHINRHHTGEKPYKCDICFKSFIVPYDLKIHRYLHTGEKPYKCPICFKGFRDNSHMIKHKRIHSNDRPYKCNECGKSFTQSYNLSVHRRTHLKEKKLNCPICGKYFENKSMLNIHRINENHHDEVV